MPPPLSSVRKLDPRRIPTHAKEIRAFVCIMDEILRLPFLLNYHRQIGVQRFFFIDNGSTDGSPEYLAEQPDCHIFACSGNFFAENVEPPVWSNALRNVFGDGHWCLSLDADEMFIYPNCETVSLDVLCEHLDHIGANALVALVVDMYGDDAIVKAKYESGKAFLNTTRILIRN